MKKKITVKDLQNYKGKKKLVCVLIKNIEEALAADKVGFEMLATGLAGKYKNDDDHPNFDQLIKMREAAPTSFRYSVGGFDVVVEAISMAFNLSVDSLASNNK